MSKLNGDEQESSRLITDMSDLNRVTGGGFVQGSAVLVSGPPGIGKSTLLLQIASCLSQKDRPVVYISGEESIKQIQLRAKRLNVAESNVILASETNVDNILSALTTMPPPAMVIVDSIQTLWTRSVDAAPGTVTQVRLSSQMLITLAKSGDTAVILVGHVTKDGQIAGPRIIEHMVDTVLYFEGEGTDCFRILRALKNRFGPTNEICIFEMLDNGLTEITSPSEVFLNERNRDTPGSAIFAGMEGSRPILLEVQSLVTPTSFGLPRRAVVGWDINRLAMILAVMKAYCGINTSEHDVYLNIAGGFRISEPAADLAIAASLMSSISGIALSSNSVYFGEVGLSGAVRSAHNAAQRVSEAQRLGFSRYIIPQGNFVSLKAKNSAVEGINTITNLMSLISLNQEKGFI